MTTPADAETIAERLRQEHPDAEPLEVDGGLLRAWIADIGADPDDRTLLAEVVTSWEALLPG